MEMFFGIPGIPFGLHFTDILEALGALVRQLGWPWGGLGGVPK